MSGNRSLRLEGTLTEGALPSLLRNLYLGRGTGLLHVRQGADRGSICFVEGHIVYGDTTVEECHMGDTLVRYGILSAEVLDRALLGVRGGGRRLGEVLKEFGILDDNGLQDALALHVREVLRCIFQWTEGSYSFEDQSPESFRGYDRALRLSTGEVILDAAWSVADPDVVRYALGDLDRVLVLTTDPLLRFQRVTLSSIDGFVLSRVDGSLTAGEILKLAPVTPEEAQRSLFGLLCIGMVEYLPVVPEPAPAEGTDQLRAQILDAHAHLGRRTHFEVLGVSRTATEAEVKAAFYRLARQLHPDVHHEPALADLRDKLSALFARITEAYGVLSEPGSRAAYEATLAVAGIRPEPEPEASAPPPSPVVDPLVARQELEGALSSAEEHYAAGRYWDAVRVLDTELLPKAQGRLASRGRILKAQCYLKNPEWRKQAEEELHAVIRQDPACPDAYYVLGTIYRSGGAVVRAASMFRKVLELKPRHAGAREGLARLDPNPSPANGGILQKLLRRG